MESLLNVLAPQYITRFCKNILRQYQFEPRALLENLTGGLPSGLIKALTTMLVSKTALSIVTPCAGANAASCTAICAPPLCVGRLVRVFS